MIETNDLRRGNIIINAIDGLQYFIRDITENYVRARYVNSTVWLLQIYSRKMSGIPLTEEWLVNFGFDKILDEDRPYFLIFKKPRMTIYFSTNEKWHHVFFEGVPVAIEYVHQLQNLYFALTSEELQLKQSV